MAAAASNRMFLSMRMLTYGLQRKFPRVNQMSCEELQKIRNENGRNLVVLVSSGAVVARGVALAIFGYHEDNVTGQRMLINNLMLPGKKESPQVLTGADLDLTARGGGGDHCCTSEARGEIFGAWLRYAPASVRMYMTIDQVTN